MVVMAGDVSQNLQREVSVSTESIDFISRTVGGLQVFMRWATETKSLLHRINKRPSIN